MTRRADSLAVILIGALAAGCNTLSPTVGIRSNSSETLNAAPLPLYAQGDRVVYTDGRDEQVVKVYRQQVEWQRSKNRSKRTWRNFILPPVRTESRSKLRREAVLEDIAPDTLWPLEVGNTVSFSSERQSTQKSSNETESTLRYWTCRVTGTANVQVAVGSFDTYRITCYRANDEGKPRRQYIWYYSPDLQAPVLRIVHDLRFRKHSPKPPRVREIVALERGLKWLSTKERAALRQSLERALERNPSGKTSVWKSRNGRTRVTITPTKTLQADSGAYCRNYIQEITYGRRKQMAAGLMCRRGRARWAVPEKT